MNKVELLGRLTKDPETMYGGADNQTAITKFTVAVKRPYSKNDETDFINCVSFGKTGEFITKYFNKGSMIALIGRIQVNQFQDKEGNKRMSTSVLAEEVFFTGSKASENTNQTTNQTQDWEEDESDLPF